MIPAFVTDYVIIKTTIHQYFGSRTASRICIGFHPLYFLASVWFSAVRMMAAFFCFREKNHAFSGRSGKAAKTIIL